MFLSLSSRFDQDIPPHLFLNMSAMAMVIEEPLLSSPIATSPASSSCSSSAADTSTAAPIATGRDILVRLTAILALVALALWANHESSKSVDISIVNSAARSRAPAGHLFDLKFVSNGKAYRIVHRASRFVEQALYPDQQYPRKPINRITLVLAGADDLASTVSVTADSATGDCTIDVGPALMAAADTDAALAAAVHWAVARLWLWDGQRTAPAPLLDAIAEYLAAAAGFDSSFPNANASSSLEFNGSSSSSSSSCWSAEFLKYCEAQRSGFVRRLNRGMRERWSDLAVDEAFGSPPARPLCAAYKSATAEKVMKSFNTTSDSVAAM